MTAGENESLGIAAVDAATLDQFDLTIEDLADVTELNQEYCCTGTVGCFGCFGPCFGTFGTYGCECF